MIVVSGTIDLDPAKHDAAVEAMKTVAEATASEEGNLSYAFFADLSDPGRFRVFEEWKDQGAIDEHFASEHMGSFMASMGDLGVTGTDIHRYEVTDKSKLM